MIRLIDSIKDTQRRPVQGTALVEPLKESVRTHWETSKIWNSILYLSSDLPEHLSLKDSLAGQCHK